ncbi:MAG TPA: hypothetical protein PLO56_01965 [Rhodothermales bacterium]|nr:hypothetical protein [Rhodothermales bacterium]
MHYQKRRGRPRRISTSKDKQQQKTEVFYTKPIEEEVIEKSPKDIIQSALINDKSIEDLRCFYKDYIVPYLVSDAGKEDLNVLLNPAKNHSKQALAAAIGFIWGNRESFLRFYNTLPEDAKTIIFHIIYFGPLYSRDLEEEFGITFYQNNKQNYYSQVKKEYQIFCNKTHSISSHINNHFIDLNIEIKKILREWLKVIIPFKLTGIAKLEELENLQRYDTESDGHSLLNIGTLVTYFQEIAILKTATNKTLVSTLKELKKIAKIQELYKDSKGSRSFIMTNLVTDLFSILDIKVPKGEPLVVLRDVLDVLFTMPSHVSKQIFSSYIYKPNYNLYSDSIQQPVLQELKELMRKLDKNIWYSPLDIANWMYHMNDIFCSYIQSFSLYSVYLYVACSENNKIRFIEKKIHSLQAIEVAAVPFIKSFFALMACLGLVEIAYTEPKNDKFCIRNEKYLTLFDGIKYVRLTDLGVYFFGQENSYVYKRVIARSEEIKITLDPDFLIISISKPDSIKEANLSRFAEQVATCRFRVDFRRFLKNCTTPEEAKGRIEEFQRIVDTPVSEWPLNWIQFIVNIQKRIRPIRAVASYQVFKLDDDPDLLQLFLTDPVLSKLILRAENRHIMVEHAHVSELKGRLGVLGYLMP